MKMDTAEMSLETSLADNLERSIRSEDLLSPVENIPEAVAKNMLPRCEPCLVEVGTLVGFRESKEPLVDFSGNHSGGPLLARSTLPLDKSHSGRHAVLLFEGADWRKPIVVGLLHQPHQPSVSTEHTTVAQQKHVEFEADGDRLVVAAEKEIVLRCGDASITLTRAGKVVIRGTHLVSRSSGMNRIKGGAVHIN